MDILIPFYNVDDLDFYSHLVESLRNFSPRNSIHIVYVEGEARDEWRQKFSLYKLGLLRTSASKTLQLFSARGKIVGKLKGLKVDVIFALSELWSLEFSSYCSAKLGIPFVVWVRGDHRRVREIRRVNWLKRVIANYLEVRYLNRAAFVIPNCISLYRKLRDWGVDEGKITSPVHNGVDASVFRPLDVPRSDKFTV